MRFSVLFSIISLTASLTGGAFGKSCTELFDSTDECLRKILYIGDNDMAFVKTEKQLNQHCKEIKASYSCLQKFGKCLRLFPKQVFFMTMRGTKKIIKERCDSPKGRREFLKHTQCLRFPEVYDFNRCVDKAIVLMKYVAENTSVDQLIPSVCCVFQDVSDCLKRKGDQYCPQKSGTGSGDYVAGVAKQMGKDLIELACRNRDTIEGCRKNEPKWMRKFDEIAGPFDKIKPQKNSLFNPLIILSEKLDSPVKS